MFVEVYPAGPFATNAYLYGAPEGEGYLIDAPPGSYPLIAQAVKDRNIPLNFLLLTHSHWDHIADAAQFKEGFPEIKIGIHKRDVGNLEKPGSDLLPLWIDIQGVHPDFYFQEGDKIGPFQVIETPGHTPGGVCFYDPKQKILFSGDTVFKGTIGNLSFPTCNAELMWKSLDKLAKLPDEVKIYPGHGEATTRGSEKWLARAREIFG